MSTSFCENPMRNLLILLPLSFFLLRHPSPQHQETTPTPPVVVVAPQEGEALQGVIDITIEVPRGSPMAEAVLYFGYAQDSSGMRFPIWEATSPRGGEPLTRWDTTTISDGDYTLYLIIHLENGIQLQATIPGLRVRNYTPIETATPTLTLTPLPGETQQPPSPTATVIPPTATPLPQNPAALTIPTLLDTIKIVGLSVLSFFILATIYRLLQRRFS